MNKTFREARQVIKSEYDRKMHALCRKHTVCSRCHDDSKPLETHTMCADCAEGLREYQREYWHKRVARGTATRGKK